MNTFTLTLLDATQTQRIDGVTSFVGEDASGSFGILPGHARLMTVLVFGLARFRTTAGDWRYLALPGALLYFSGNELSLGTRRFLLDDDYERISAALHEQLLAEEQTLDDIRKSLHRMEEQLFRRLWDMGHGTGSAG